MAEITWNSATNWPDLNETYQRVIKNVFPSGSEAKRQVAGNMVGTETTLYGDTDQQRSSQIAGGNKYASEVQIQKCR